VCVCVYVCVCLFLMYQAEQELKEQEEKQRVAEEQALSSDPVLAVVQSHVRLLREEILKKVQVP